MRQPSNLLTKESPRQIIFEDFKINLPIKGGWGYDFDSACIIDKNDPSVIKGVPFDGVAIEYVFVEKRIYEEMIIFPLILALIYCLFYIESIQKINNLLNYQ